MEADQNPGSRHSHAPEDPPPPSVTRRITIWHGAKAEDYDVPIDWSATIAGKIGVADVRRHCAWASLAGRIFSG